MQHVGLLLYFRKWNIKKCGQKVSIKIACKSYIEFTVVVKYFNFMVTTLSNETA